MRILNIMQCTHLGGTEQLALLCMAGLQARGHQCEVVSLNPIAELGPLLDTNHIPAKGLVYRGRAGWRSLVPMHQAFRSVPAQAVMMTGHNFAAMLALGDLCTKRRLLCVHHYHTGTKPRWEWKVMYRLALRQFPAVAFDSDFIRREAEELYPPISGISHTVRNPFIVAKVSDEDRSAARKQLGLPLTARIVGNAGRLIDTKRFDVFLRVAREVASIVPEAMFLIAGDGPLRSELEELATSFGITDRVRWLGWQLDLKPFYSALDVLHFNSDWDALGRAPLEALAFGVPVVASVLNGGLSEIMGRGEHGFLVSSHDIDWLAEKIVFILGHEEEARRMALTGQQYLADLCSVERHVTEISGLMGLDD